MEALTATPPAPPAVHHLTLRTLATTDSWISDPSRAALESILLDADDREVPYVPRSIGMVLPLLTGAPDQLRIALEAILQYDLHEAAEGLSVLVWRGHQDAILTAAALVANPLVSADFRDLVSAHGSDLAEEWQRDLYQTRMDPDHIPTSDIARLDRQVRWLPGAAEQSAFAVAAVAPPSNPKGWRGYLLLLCDLVSAGIVVRRTATGAHSRDIDSVWLRRWAHTIGDQPTAQISVPSFKALERREERQKLVRLVSRLFPTVKVDLMPAQPLGQEPLGQLPDVSSIEVFESGALPRPEVAYLSGLRGSQFESFRKHPSLHPVTVRGMNYWSFSQVVGLRASRYLFSQSGRYKGMAQVAAKLVTLTRLHQTVPVAITRSGEVLVKDDDGVLYDVETNQIVEERILSLVDDVYHPFNIMGASVPALLRPSKHTEVNPQVVAGLPHIGGTRVPATTIGSAVMAARQAGSTNPWQTAASDFGLDETAVRDAEGVALAIQAAP